MRYTYAVVIPLVRYMIAINFYQIYRLLIH